MPTQRTIQHTAQGIYCSGSHSTYQYPLHTAVGYIIYIDIFSLQ